MAEQPSQKERAVQQASETDRERLEDAQDKAERSEASGRAVTPREAGAEPSGYRGDNPATAGPGQTAVNSGTPENNAGHLNPSAPEDANVTPGSLPEK